MSSGLRPPRAALFQLVITDLDNAESTPPPVRHVARPDGPEHGVPAERGLLLVVMTLRNSCGQLGATNRIISIYEQTVVGRL